MPRSDFVFIYLINQRCRCVMASILKYHVRLVGGGFVIQDFSSDAILNFNQVARTLGISSSTLRRLLRDGDFPQSHISRGTRDYWQRHDVRAYLLRRILIDKAAPANLSRYQNVDEIDEEDDREFGRKPIDLQGSERSFQSYSKLMAEDPEQFAREHPNLKRWMKDKGLL